MKEGPGSFIDDDCIIKDEVFQGIQNLVICDICKKILKNPMMCNNCQKAFCKECIDKKGKCTTASCKVSEFVKNKNALPVLKMVKYKCSNCKEEVKYEDVEKHLEDGCMHRENEIRLADTIYEKRTLKKLTPDEVGKAKSKNKVIYHLSSK